ncbi:hypothetical protein Tsubulata_022525 [Turnera subulata]|uniref:MutL C-terminal dimerisation domain-containing protein n=1 Tax=Turnera subulata TaxID=218843 RepID=A0A9Q0JE62_9ROSI|nr:hypothetical protein Tsubulata_022525 [Turnera subulata]
MTDINSRFICKGPIHKLLNHLATTYKYTDPSKGCSESQKGKKIRPQNCLAYFANISCPSSLYDLTFEPSKTYVEFKEISWFLLLIFQDWGRLLTFVEKSVQKLWRENAANRSLHHSVDDMVCGNEVKEGDDITSAKEGLFAAQLPENSAFAPFLHGNQNRQPSCYLGSSSFDMLTKEVNHILSSEYVEVPSREFCMNGSEFKEKQDDESTICQSDYSFQLWDNSFCKRTPKVTKERDSTLLESDVSFLCSNDIKDMISDTEKFCDQMEGFIVSSDRQCVTPEIGLRARNGYVENFLSSQYQELSNEIEDEKRNRKPFLRSCSSQRSQPLDRAWSIKHEGSEYPVDSYYGKRRRVCAGEIFDHPEADFSNQTFDAFPQTLWQDKGLCIQKFPSHPVRVNASVDFDVSSGASMKPSLHHADPLSGERGIASSSSEWFSAIPDALCEATAWDDRDFNYDNAHKGSVNLDTRPSDWDFADRMKSDLKFEDEIALQDCSQENCISSRKQSLLDFNDYAYSSEDMCGFVQGHLEDELYLEHPDRSIGEKDRLPVNKYSEGHKRNDTFENRGRYSRHQYVQNDYVPRKQCRRSYSAPPFHRPKRKFISLNFHLKEEGKPCAQRFLENNHGTEAKKLFHPSHQEDLLLGTRADVMSQSNVMLEIRDIPKDTKFDHSGYLKASDSPIEGFLPKGIEEKKDSATKWRDGLEQIAYKKMSCERDNQRKILDINSGFLHLASHSLVPESIPMNFLEGAKVLQQVDKKFIPIVSGQTLAIIDQHAADERIRLEELRQKVKAKTITYLNAEKELILPEMGYQLLQNYAEQVKDWGWLCNIQAQGSGTFKKNLNILHRQPTVVILLAVPCILGVNLSDEDLLEFLQQLAETDGSSTIPPSVLRVLNFKACRGAIMFGDSLLHSECALIVEELKKTSLCFQCAHGRPTTAPLVNLEALHKQIARLGKSSKTSNDSWHGLRRQAISLERTAQRLHSARA